MSPRSPVNYLIVEVQNFFPLFQLVSMIFVKNESWNRYHNESFDIILSCRFGVLHCKYEPDNIVDKNAVSIIRTYSIGKDSIVGHLPENISKLCTLFLKVLNTAIRA